MTHRNVLPSVEQANAEILRDGLMIIDGKTREEILAALGIDNCKASTKALRARARIAWIKDDPSFCLWAKANPGF